MKKLGEIIQSADWKTEKHQPVIECPDGVKSGEKFLLTVSIGKEIPHPNTTEHHISWIRVFFQPEGERFTHQLAGCDFAAHGASVQGANQGPAYTEPSVTGAYMLKKSGTLIAASYCNIHGLWEASREIKVS